MRRILTGIAAAALVAVGSSLALAGEQDMAAQIAQKLHDSGQLGNYRIGVKYSDGTAWVRGVVSSRQQMNAALKLTYQTPGVVRVVNELTLASTAAAGRTAASEPPQVARPSRNPLRDTCPETMPQPQKVTLANRLQSVIAGQPEPTASTRAVYLSSGPARPAIARVSAEDSQPEVPQQVVAPQRARPMATSNGAVNRPEQGGQVVPNGGPLPMYTAPAGNMAAARYDQPNLPNYAWPSYASYPNYAALTYPKQYSPTAWPYIGPFYPYPQVPMGWRKVTLEWSDGWWFLDFKDQPASCWHR